MRHFGLRSLSVSLVLLAATVAGARADVVVDDESGFLVDVPEGFKAVPNSTPGAFKVAFTKKDAEDFSCKFVVGYLPESYFRPGDRQVTVADTNKKAKETLPAIVELALDGKLKQVSSAPFVLQEVEGVAVVAEPVDPELKASLKADTRFFYAFFVTPVGRTNVACSGKTENFDAYIPEFEKLVRGSILPVTRLDVMRQGQ